MARKVWFITGASKGFGMELTKAALGAITNYAEAIALAMEFRSVVS